MRERLFRLLLGALLLGILYFDQQALLPVLLVLLVIEGMSDLALTRLLGRLSPRLQLAPPESTPSCATLSARHFDFSAERAWRLSVATMLVLAFYVLNQQLWFVPWFMGFAILGAGLSGVCPVLSSLRLLGFK